MTPDPSKTSDLLTGEVRQLLDIRRQRDTLAMQMEEVRGILARQSVSQDTRDRAAEMEKAFASIENNLQQVEARALAWLETSDRAVSGSYRKLVQRLWTHGWLQPDQFLRLIPANGFAWPGAQPAVTSESRMASWFRQKFVRSMPLEATFLVEWPPLLVADIGRSSHVVATFSDPRDSALATNLVQAYGSLDSPAWLGVENELPGCKVAALLEKGTFDILGVGRRAWSFWGSEPDFLFEWMMDELSRKVPFLLVEEGPSVNDTLKLESLGWCKDAEAPEGWWLGCSLHQLPGRTPIRAFRSKTLWETADNPPVRLARTVIAGDAHVKISHSLRGPRTHSAIWERAMAKEAAVWERLGGTHPLLPPSLIRGTDVFLQIPCARPVFLPRGPISNLRALTMQLLDLVDFLHRQNALPGALNPSDVLLVDGRPALTRLGDGLLVSDPLEDFASLLRDLQLPRSTHALPSPALDAFVPTAFPSAIRDIAALAANSYTFESFLEAARKSFAREWPRP